MNRIITFDALHLYKELPVPATKDEVDAAFAMGANPVSVLTLPTPQYLAGADDGSFWGNDREFRRLLRRGIDKAHWWMHRHNALAFATGRVQFGEVTTLYVVEGLAVRPYLLTPKPGADKK